MGQIILASASPRRKELLEQIGLEFEICPAKGEEVISKSVPEEVVMELSEQKAKEVAGMVKDYESGHEELMTPQDIYEKTDSDQEKEEQKKVRHEEDLTLIQGIIDVFWIEKDGIVLLDYKTDRVQQAKELIDRYATQLKLYADALERVFAARKLKVKEILIYSFSLEQLITL